MDEEFRMKVLWHLFLLSLCLRSVYIFCIINAIWMFIFPVTFTWISFLCGILAFLLEWYIIDLLIAHNLVKKREIYDDE